MWTNEFEYDYTISTIMDETDEYEDIQVLISEKEVFIQQWDDAREKYEIVVMTHEMFAEIQKAMNTPEGMFKNEK